MNESAVIPIATIRPATPGSDRRYPCVQDSRVITAYVMIAASTSEATVSRPSTRYWTNE